MQKIRHDNVVNYLHNIDTYFLKYYVRKKKQECLNLSCHVINCLRGYYCIATSVFLCGFPLIISSQEARFGDNIAVDSTGITIIIL